MLPMNAHLKKLLVIFLFTLSTITTALHEVGHTHAHDSGNCPVCIVHDHVASGDIITPPSLDAPLHFVVLFHFTCNPYFAPSSSDNQSRAPPVA